MNDITPNSPTSHDDSVDHADPFAVGKWVWVKDTNRDDEEYEWLGCVMHHGSNYVRVQHPKRENYGYSDIRVHVDDLYERLRPEPNAERVIADLVGKHQRNVRTLLGEINSLTQRLGVVPRTAIADKTGDETNALAVISDQVDTDAHKKDLIKAKDEDLPALFKKVEEENSLVAKWMGASMLPMMAQVAPMKSAIKGIETRIYTIELYAGLTEGREKVKDGDPAARHEKLRVMQRLHYMDEECLLDYDAGGMEIDNLSDFDLWLSRPQNFERLLPFPRCAVAFQIRRNVKDRYARNFSEAWFNIMKAQSDMWTFLYVRNGDQLWRVGCDFEFPDKIFPDADDYDPTREMMMEMRGSSVESIFPRHEYEVAVAEHERALAEWEAENEKAEEKKGRFWAPGLDSKYRGAEPFNPTSVYYDDAMEMADERIREFNRIGVILQGLFDRSMILHPHTPVQVWDPDSFARSIELIYDATTLTHGDPPDFAAFRAKLNQSLGLGSVVIGQERVWAEREAKRENERRQRDWRRDRRYDRDLETYYPEGDPGPGFVVEIEDWKPRARKAVFRWTRESRDYGVRYRDRPEDIPCTITVEADRLFNVSAYQPGDYLQFFQDPRTRQDYLKWAPLLLAAEDWHAKNKETK